jgi:hypothetical protein
MGFLSNINRARKKATKKILNPVVKGVSKITDKFLPNELRFMAPYAAGIGTLMLPGSMGPLMRAFSAAGLNSLGQIAADETPIEDISDLNALSMAISGGLGALGSDSVSGAMRSGIETGVPAEAVGATGPAELGMTTRGPGFLQGAENLGREGIASLSDYVTGSREALANLGKNPADLFSSADKFAGARDAAKALGPTLSQATGDVAYETAVDLKDEQDRLDAEEEADIERTTTANESERADYQMTFMRQAGIGEDEIQETLAMNDLSEYYVPPASAAEGGIIGLKEGGMLNFGGREMDLRGGGFVPIGKKERADDVPARLSKNEFVMTADAVRAAGGGSVNKGAQRMYDIMNKLEARA